MATSKNFGVNIFTDGGKAWSARAEEYQIAKGNAVKLKATAKLNIAKLTAGLESLDNLKGSISEDKIPEMRTSYEEQIRKTESALKEQLDKEAAFDWTKSEKDWAKSILTLKKENERIASIIGFYKSEYGMDVSNEWAKSVLAALALDRLGNATARQYVHTGRIDANKATIGSVLTAYMTWNVRQMFENGLKKYVFTDDIVEMYRTKKEREERAKKAEKSAK